MIELKPAQPGKFGSYPEKDVTWLLTDLSNLKLEQDTETREKAIQNGTSYSEMLPEEYQPTQEYVNLFHQTLEETAEKIATSIGTVGKLIWDLHQKYDQTPVLVSLARAGTPIGVLLKRYYHHTRNIEIPHYTISIIRGQGIDQIALQHILDLHPASSIRFVDGWTGKGAIQKQLTEAVIQWKQNHPNHVELDDTLAVLADPGNCTPIYGTREDFLIPSACLNSTVSGLVSRTFYRQDIIQSGMFHGAKYYKKNLTTDVSNQYVDIIASHFPLVKHQINKQYNQHYDIDTNPTWAGWKDIEKITQQYNIPNINMVKPGIGETTRVLLRRIPWKILVNPDRYTALEHVRVLAAERNVPLVEVPDLTYSCVGIIKPSNENVA